jgi:hypothetical protein
MIRWIARVLAIAAVTWCIAIGIWLWITPIRSDGEMTTAYADSSGIAQQTTYRVTESRSFAEMSAFGPVPLLIPAVIAAIGAWAVWRRRLLPATIAAGLLVMFVFLAGFSIGTVYVPAAAALVWAIVARADS